MGTLPWSLVLTASTLLVSASFVQNAQAATASVTGSLYNGGSIENFVFYKTVRYHTKASVLKVKLKRVNEPCGGGALGLRPLRTSGTWMASLRWWVIGAGDNAINITKTWGAAGTIPAGNFTLAASTNAGCGIPAPRATVFTADLTY